MKNLIILGPLNVQQKCWAFKSPKDMRFFMLKSLEELRPFPCLNQLTVSIIVLIHFKTIAIILETDDIVKLYAHVS